MKKNRIAELEQENNDLKDELGSIIDNLDAISHAIKHGHRVAVVPANEED